MDEFKRHGGVLKTAELKELGLSSRQIKRLLEEGKLTKIKHGYYELAGEVNPEEVMLARLFPEAVIFFESTLLHGKHQGNSEVVICRIKHTVLGLSNMLLKKTLKVFKSDRVSGILI